MSEQQVPHDPELNEIEAALGSLAPSRNRLDRDRLMFESGRVAHRPATSGRWTWPAISAVLSIGLVVALIHRPEPRVVERLVYVQAPPPAQPQVQILTEKPTPAPPVPGSLGHYARYDHRNLRFNADDLPEPPPILSLEFTALDSTSDTSGSLLRSEIAKLLNPGESL